tara:strand:- start:737 stop:1261 length:525 start_codon:yes stop_codon:yes gene_type:complete
MAGSLVLIDSVTASNNATVTLGGANWDNSFGTYMVTHSNVVPQTDTQALLFRMLDSSNNAISSTSVRQAWKVYRANTTPENAYGGGNFFMAVDNYIGTATGEIANGTTYIFGANISGEFTYITQNTAYVNNSTTLRGMQGGAVLELTQIIKGVQFYMNSGNIVSGNFKLYGIKK